MKPPPATRVVAAGLSVLLVAAVAQKGYRHRPPPAELVAGRPYLLVNLASGRCLGVAGGRAKPGELVTQGPHPASARAGDRWVLESHGDHYAILNAETGMALEVPAGSRERGVQAIVWHPGAPPTHQLWRVEPAWPGYIIRAGHSGQVLAVRQGSLEEGAVVVQWDRMDGVGDQVWRIEPVVPGHDLE